MVNLSFNKLKNKQLCALVIIIVFSFFGCQSYSKVYEEVPDISYEPKTDQSIEFDAYYIEIANDFYQVTNYDSVDLYRNKDSAIVIFNFNDKASYQDINSAAQFFNDLFITRHGQTIISVGKMSGFLKKIYDDDYHFWQDAYFICKVNGEDAYSAFYQINDKGNLERIREKFTSSQADLFQLNLNQLKRFDNLANLNDVGKCIYYRNAFGTRLYVDIYYDKQLDEDSFEQLKETVDNIFLNVSDACAYYYSASYSTVVVRIKDNTGVYYKKLYNF